jgi:hypothetical protein
MFASSASIPRILVKAANGPIPVSARDVQNCAADEPHTHAICVIPGIASQHSHGAHVLKLWVLCPWRERLLIFENLYILEAGILEVDLQRFPGHVSRTPKLSHCIAKEIRVFFDLRRHGVVVAVRNEGYFRQLDIPAGFGVT